MSSSEGEEEADAVHRRIMDIRSSPRPHPLTLSNPTEVDVAYPASKNSNSNSSLNQPRGDGASRGGVTLDLDLEGCRSHSDPKSPQGNGVSLEEDFGFDFNFFYRFYKLHGLLFLSPTSISTLLFLFLLSFCLLQEYIAYRVGLISGGFYKVLTDKDVAGFRNQTLAALAIIGAMVLTKSTNQYIQKVLTVTWRQLLTKAVHRIYFTDIRYYQLNVLDKSIDNPDQRITQDISTFCTTYCEILPKLLISPFVIGYYCYQAYDRSGWQGPLGCFCFFVVATLVNKVLMTPIVNYVVKQEKCEGDFRFVHMLVRVNSESIAFQNASSFEGGKANASLDKLLKTQHSLYCRQFFLNFSVNLFDYLGSIFSYLMLAIPIFSGRYDHLTPGELSSLISQNAFVLIYLIYTFTSLVDVSAKFTDIAGVAHRISSLIERLNTLGDFWKDLFPENEDHRTPSTLDLYKEWSSRRGPEGTRGEPYNNGVSAAQLTLLPAWTLKCVSFSAPLTTKTLVSNLNVTFHVGESVLIVGNSSAGKTSLLRLLRGLWPHSDGFVKRHYPPGPHGVFYCPQKPYLTFGTLREQICFPLIPDTAVEGEDNLMIHYFTKLKMKSFLERVGGLDHQVSWSVFASLSPGEMQRICFIRLFYHRPLIAVLDEATSALPMEMEDVVYSECRRLNITTISVGHRDSLKQYHEKLLTLGSKGRWTLEPLPSKQLPGSNNAQFSIIP